MHYIHYIYVNAPHIKHTCNIVMYDSIAARVKREVRVASLAVVFVPFRFISPFGYN